MSLVDLYLRKMAKQALRFEHNGFKLYSIQNWLISGPFLGNKTCLMALFTGILGRPFVILFKKGTKSSEILNTVQFKPILLKSESLFGPFC